MLQNCSTCLHAICCAVPPVVLECQVVPSADEPPRAFPPAGQKTHSGTRALGHSGTRAGVIARSPPRSRDDDVYTMRSGVATRHRVSRVPHPPVMSPPSCHTAAMRRRRRRPPPPPPRGLVVRNRCSRTSISWRTERSSSSPSRSETCCAPSARGSSTSRYKQLVVVVSPSSSSRRRRLSRGRLSRLNTNRRATTKRHNTTKQTRTT